MPADVKRAADGVYLLFLADQVTDDELAQVIERYRRNAEMTGRDEYAVVIEPIQVTNPLRAARMFLKHTRPTVHYIVVNNGRDGAVMTERIVQQLAGKTETCVEGAAHQQAALDRAMAILGVEPDDALTCDYL